MWKTRINPGQPHRLPLSWVGASRDSTPSPTDTEGSHAPAWQEGGFAQHTCCCPVGPEQAAISSSTRVLSHLHPRGSCLIPLSSMPPSKKAAWIWLLPHQRLRALTGPPGPHPGATSGPGFPCGCFISAPGSRSKPLSTHPALSWGQQRLWTERSCGGPDRCGHLPGQLILPGPHPS